MPRDPIVYDLATPMEKLLSGYSKSCECTAYRNTKLETELTSCGILFPLPNQGSPWPIMKVLTYILVAMSPSSALKLSATAQIVIRPIIGNLTARLRPVNNDSQFVQMFTTTHLLDFIRLRAKEKQTSLS